jgi:hypothetical protein
MVKRQNGRFSSLMLVNGVVDPDGELFSTNYFSTEPFRLLGNESSYTWQVNNGPINKAVLREVVADPVAAPVGVKVGSTGRLGNSKFIRDAADSSGISKDDIQEYTYSVEAASSADTAWVCENSVDLTAKTRVIEDKQQFCILTNANSDILGLRLDAQAFDANGKVTASISLR